MSAGFSPQKFVSQYPGGKIGATAVEFVSEDSDYRIYIPGADKRKSTVQSTAHGGLAIVLVQDHIRHGAHDDHSTSTLTIDSSGRLSSSLNDLEIDIETGGRYEFPALKATSDALKIMVALEVVSGGAGLAVEATAEVLSMMCTLFNLAFAAVAVLSDDGGRLNFPAVICHNMNKTVASVRLEEP